LLVTARKLYVVPFIPHSHSAPGCARVEFALYEHTLGFHEKNAPLTLRERMQVKADRHSNNDSIADLQKKTVDHVSKKDK